MGAAVTAQRTLAMPVVLNRAARIIAGGHGGQMLADSTAVLLAGIDLIDRGARRLRDLPTPVGMFQVRAEGLPRCPRAQVIAGG